MKLTKKQTKLHEQACALLEKETLTFDEKWLVLENWHEGANHLNGKAGAFFTPPYLARDFSIDCYAGKVVDICAGIGALAFALYHRYAWDDIAPQITCIEINPAYVEVGKKILPEATWICADIFEIWRGLERFDSAIANPPFGKIQTDGKAPYYSGADFEYKIIDIAARIADYGTFIIPQQSAPFRFSGAQCYQELSSRKHSQFFKQTRIELTAGCGIDTSYHSDDWRGVSPVCEVVCADFDAFHLQDQTEAQADFISCPVFSERNPDQLALI